MKFSKRYINYLVLFFWLIALMGLFSLTLVANIKVNIPDPNLEAVIRETLDQPFKPLTSTELSKITELDATNRGITDITGIEHLSNLTILNLYGNRVSDLSPLSSLKKLKKLNLVRNNLIDLQSAHFEALEGIRLEQLELSYNFIFTELDEVVWLEDVCVLSMFPTLEHVNLADNNISDIDCLDNLVNLEVLNLQTNHVQDITAIQHMVSLKDLNLENNDVIDLSPLSQLTSLKRLNLSANRNVSSIQPLSSLSQLKALSLNHIPIAEEISSLQDLDNLEELSLENSQLTRISPLSSLTKLTDLNLRDNNITDLTPLTYLTDLQSLDLQSNQNAENFSALENLTALKKLDIQNVPLGEDIFSLRRMKNLRFLDLRNCGISDTTVLGNLMASGALQDNAKTGRLSTVDLRDNPIPVSAANGYQPIRDYWTNISNRLPFCLPDYAPLEAPVFSATSGYYADEFSLTLSTTQKDVEIYYTLDGSEPDQDDFHYEAPIRIKSRAGEANILSAIDGISPRWKPLDNEVYKATVVRAIAISTEGQAHSPIATHTYLVDRTEPYTLPVISLTTEQANLFDPKIGIYVMGDIYAANFEAQSHLNPWERSANFTQSGPAWQRPVHIEYISADGGPSFSQDANLRINGGATRELPQKSLRIYAQCDKGCPPSINFALFPGLTDVIDNQPIDEFQTFVLRNAGQDWSGTMFRDAFEQTLISQNTRLDTQAYQPCIVLLNGEYWGIYNIRERLDEFYLANHYRVSPDDVVILSTNALGSVSLDVGNPGDERDYLDMIHFVETHDLSLTENYQYIETQIDMENFIDYQIAQIFFDNYDWPQNNVSFWRVKSSIDTTGTLYGHDGKWRWFIFDLDQGFGFDGGETVSVNSLERSINPSREWSALLLRSLLQNEQFRNAFLNRFMDHFNSTFQRSQSIALIDSMESTLEPEFEEQINRWRGDPHSMEEWHQSVKVLRSYAETRPSIVRGHLLDYFNIAGTSQIELNTNPDMGYIHVNRLDIQPQTPGVTDPGQWSGLYLQGIPLEISAIPYPGYRFDHWENLPDQVVNQDHITITPTDDLSLTAVFIEE